jgi:hypothetical protein
MGWTDYGVIFPVKSISDWIQSHAYVPTAIQLQDRIRVFVAFWDAANYGRLGYIDTDLQDPRRILGYSHEPLLADSLNGSFDCDGVTPLSIVKTDEQLYLYYAGWQKLIDQEARYTLFTGLAVSSDAQSFTRYSPTPILGPTSTNKFVRTGIFALKEEDRWRAWFADFVENTIIDDKVTPSYRLSLIESDDGFSWPEQGKTVFDIDEEIFGYGRSAIWRQNGQYLGLFPVRYRDGGYRAIKFSESADGYQWSPLSMSGLAFGPEHTCDRQQEVSFPAVIHQESRIILFYNGDDFGRAGLRCAVYTE